MKKSNIALSFALAVAFAAALPLLCLTQEAPSVPSVFHEVQEIVAFSKRPDAVGIPVKMMAHVVHVSMLREDTCVVASHGRRAS